MSDLLVQSETLAEIPFLRIRLANAAPGPVVVYLHGFGADKRQGLSLGYALAQHGMECICPDAWLHGDRYDPKVGALLEGRAPSYVYPPGTGLDTYCLMHEVIQRMTEEMGVLLSRLANQDRVRSRPVGVTGLSMGAFATYCIAASYPQIAAAVPIAGVPAFTARWRDVVLETSSYKKWAEEMHAAEGHIARHTAFFASLDPFPRLHQFAPRPLLILHGDRDLDSPKKYTVDLLRALQPHYASHPDLLRLQIHDEAGHEFNRAMQQATVEWFNQHLAEGT